MNKKIAFLCGARDFHAMDWYHSALELMPFADISLVTDLISGEGFKKIITEKDKVHKLIILDPFLFRNQSSLGDKWRNLLKLILLPIQVILLKHFAKKNPNTIFYAHSMYYLVLARAANVNYVGTPQGSDILVKPFKSKFYKIFAIYGLKKAKNITVDSKNMQKGVKILVNRFAHIIQNGIDITSIKEFNTIIENKPIINQERSGILSIRGFTKLYRIKEIIEARNLKNKNQKISFIYPFYDNIYKTQCLSILDQKLDIDKGRVDRKKMYELFLKCELVVSIPVSDSSPRSVYEAIFCGVPVAITYNSYFDLLPSCMQARIIIVDLNNVNWLFDAILKSIQINQTKYIPSDAAIELFDQKESFKKIQKLLFD
jgi:hypothetical protein